MQLTHHEIITDYAYNEGFAKGVKSMQRKFDKLKEDAKYFFQMYESSYGEPDESIPDNAYYFKLRKKLFN
jgi:hypothetical protein